MHSYTAVNSWPKYHCAAETLNIMRVISTQDICMTQSDGVMIC